MIKLTLKEIAELVQGELQGEASLGIEGAAGLDEAGPTDLSYLASPKFEAQLASTKARCVLLDPSKKGAHPFAAVYVADPKLAFAKVLARLEAYVAPKLPSGIHPTAVVHPYAKIGRDAHIGPHAVVESGAFVGERTMVGAGCYLGHNVVVGKDCRLYPHVVVRERCTLGDRVILHPGVVVGADGYSFLPSPKGHQKVPQIGRVHLEDDVEIGANSCVDRAMTGVTRIGRGTKIDNLVQIGHNVRIGEHCLIVSQAGIAGSTRLGDWVVLGGQVGVGDHLTIGSKAQVGGGSGVMGDLPEGAVVFGYPARPFRESMKLQALIGRLPELYEAYKKARKAAGTEAGA